MAMRCVPVSTAKRAVHTMLLMMGLTCGQQRRQKKPLSGAPSNLHPVTVDPDKICLVELVLLGSAFACAADIILVFECGTLFCCGQISFWHH